MTDKQWPNCKCTFAQYMVGDGCGICNPEFYQDMKDDEMTDNQDALLPCPFCGGEPERAECEETDNIGGWVVSCKKCFASTRVFFGEKIGLEEAWNTRQAITEPAVDAAPDRDDDPAEAAYWRFDARRKGYNPYLHVGERAAFKQEYQNALAGKPKDGGDLAARIDAAKRRLCDAKAIHTRWYEMPGYEAEKFAQSKMNELEQIIYSAICYLNGVPGLYLTAPAVDVEGLKREIIDFIFDYEGSLLGSDLTDHLAARGLIGNAPIFGEEEGDETIDANVISPAVDKALRHLRAHAEWQPLDNWHEDDGPAFWTKFPVCEPYYAGSPLDTKWPGYHTHFIPMSVFDRLIDKDGNLIQQNTPGTSDAAPVAVRTQAGAPAEPADAQERGDELKCPSCGGPADNGHDRCYPPNAYNCTKCEGKK